MPEPQAQHAVSFQTSERLTGTIVGRFAIRSALGKGGMGEVYLAEDTKLRRPVALKRMAPRSRPTKEIGGDSCTKRAGLQTQQPPHCRYLRRNRRSHRNVPGDGVC